MTAYLIIACSGLWPTSEDFMVLKDLLEVLILYCPVTDATAQGIRLCKGADDMLRCSIREVMAIPQS